MKPLHVYSFLGALLMIAAFIAGGIFLKPAQASVYTSSPQKKVKDQDFKKGCNPPQKPDPKIADVLGTITTINGSTLILKVWEKGDINFTVHTQSSTHFVSKITGNEITLQDLKIGDFVIVSGVRAGDTALTADEVVHALVPSNTDVKKKEPKPGTSDDIMGTITSINGATLTIKGFKDGKTFTVTLDSHTELGSKLVGHEISASELKVNDFVIVQTVERNGSLLAQQLTVGLPPTDTPPTCKK